MVDVNIGYDGLQRAAGQLTTGQAEITERLRALKTMIDQLVSSEFRTQLASGRFQDSYQQWNQGAENVINGLEGMSSFLGDVVREHQDLDNRLAGGANR
jgi:WXG100 family type VII secretion target